MTDTVRKIIFEALRYGDGLSMPNNSAEDAHGIVDCILAKLASDGLTISRTEAPDEALRRVVDDEQLAALYWECDPHGDTNELALKIWECLRRARTALSSPSGWRPMSTAPQDGTCIIVYWVDQEVTEVAHFTDLHDDEGPQWYTLAADYLPVKQLSHWQPLPSSPTGGRET